MVCDHPKILICDRAAIPYIQGISEVVIRILSNINVQVHMKPFSSLETRPFALRGMVWFHPYQALILVECATSAQSMYDNYIHWIIVY